MISGIGSSPAVVTQGVHKKKCKADAGAMAAALAPASTKSTTPSAGQAVASASATAANDPSSVAKQLMNVLAGKGNQTRSRLNLAASLSDGE